MEAKIITRELKDGVRAGQQPLVTDEMRRLAEEYFVLSKRGVNYHYVGPQGEYQKWYYVKNQQKKNVNTRKWVQDNYEYNRQRCKKKGRQFRFLEKIRALQKVVGSNTIQCSQCTQTDIRVLTINHLNGDGGKDRTRHGAMKTYRMILEGRRVDDLDVRCHNCNILYEYELGRRALPDNWEELWATLQS